MRYSFYIAFVFLFICSHYSAQENAYFNDSISYNNPTNSIKDKLYYGGNVSFNIFNGWIFFDAAPFIGYKVKPKFSVGTGAKYIYRGNHEIQHTESYYGGNIFSRYSFHSNFFVHAEYELLNVYELRQPPFSTGDRTLASMLLLGGAYSTKIGGNATVQIMLMYDFIDDHNSPYQSYYLFGSSGPSILYRIGFSFGF